MKATDYVRCAKCRRLVLRSKATRVEGVLYGSECLKVVLSRIRDSESSLGEE